jgi:hypothetical protein
LKNLTIGEKRSHNQAFIGSIDSNLNINDVLKESKIIEEEDESSYGLENNDLTKLNFDITEINDFLPKKISFNFSKASEKCGIKKMMQIFLLNKIFDKNSLDTNKVEKSSNLMDIEEKVVVEKNFLEAQCIGIGPSEINLRFFKSKPQELAEQEETIRIILANSREFSGGVFKFNLIKVCDLLSISQVDLLNFLFTYQSKGDLGYEGKEESMFINIEKFSLSIKKMIILLSDINKEYIDASIKKVF